MASGPGGNLFGESEQCLVLGFLLRAFHPHLRHVCVDRVARDECLNDVTDMECRDECRLHVISVHGAALMLLQPRLNATTFVDLAIARHDWVNKELPSNGADDLVRDCVQCLVLLRNL